MTPTSRQPFPTIHADTVAWISEQEMIEVDRVMMEDLEIDLIQMMENAGRNLARLVLDRYEPSSVVVFAGSGGNGGGGLVGARHLHNAGVDVTVAVTQDLAGMTPVPAHQLRILEHMGLPWRHITAKGGTELANGGTDSTSTSASTTEAATSEEVLAALPAADVAIDAVIGYSLRGAPRGISQLYIAAINQSKAAGVTVVALDTPSGVNVTDGSTPGAAVKADATLTLALPKRGLAQPPAVDHVGELYLADISVPPAVTGAYGCPSPDYSAGSVVRISPA